MSWREIGEADLEWIVPFLRAHIQSSMFFLSNLEAHGLGSDAPYGLRMWALDSAARGLIGVTNGGSILLQAPTATAADWQATEPFWRDVTLTSLVAEAAQAEVQAVEEVGLDGDMLEAQCFAWLAARVARGLPLSAPGTTGVAAPVAGGRLSPA